MNIKAGVLFPLVFLLSLPNIFSIELTEKAIEVQLKGEYNQSLNYHGEMAVIGDIKLNNLYQLRGGGSVGRSENDIDFNAFLNAAYSPFLTLPLSFSISYIYNGLPEYKDHTHSILPLVSFNNDRAGISLGLNFRFNINPDEDPTFEPIFSFYGYFNFINMDTLHIGMGIGNYNDFHSKYLRELSLRTYISLFLGGNWTISNEIELMQNWIDSFEFYGFAWRGSVKYSW